MAQSTAARSRSRSPSRSPSRASGSSRSPELDMARAVALLAAVVVLVAPGGLPPWLEPPTSTGLGVAPLLPAVFATIAGVAIAHQHAAHAAASRGWWTGRLTRRVVLLVAAGLLLQLLVLLPTPAAALDRIRFTGDLARLGVATGIGLVLVRLPEQSRGALAAALVLGHAALVFGVDTPAAQGGALAGLDARLLAGRAVAPIDPDGITALAPTVALVLVGAAIGGWLRARARGARTVGLLAVDAAACGVAAVGLARLLPVDATVWSPPVLAGGVAVTLALLAIGQAGTRRPLPDRLVATLAAGGRVTLPLWLLAVVGAAWFGESPPVRWFVREVLWPPLGDTGASLALGLLVGAGLLRLGTAMVDRGWQLRA